MKRARLVRRPVIGFNPLYQLEKIPVGDGGVPEWLKGTDCKSVGYAYVGSNPTPSTSLRCAAAEAATPKPAGRRRASERFAQLRLGRPELGGRRERQEVRAASARQA